MTAKQSAAKAKVDYYDQFVDLASSPDEPIPIDGRERKAATLFRRLLGRATRLLDIGCGDGRIATYLGRTLGAEEIHGIEVSPRWADLARARGVKVAMCDIEDGSLPYEDASFAAIFCGEFIEHLVDPDHLLDEIRRLLTPRGLCVITTPNLAAWPNRIALMFGYQPFPCGVSFRHDVGRLPVPKYPPPCCQSHLRVFTYKALKELLAVSGFKTVALEGLSIMDTIASPPSGALGLLLRAVDPFDRLLTLRPALGLHMIVAIQR